MLFTVTLAGAGYYFFFYVPRHKKPGEPVFVLPNYILTFSPIRSENAPGYVLPEKLEVWNTPAIIRSVISTLKSGDQVFVLGRFRQWARVRLNDGRIGWVDESGLLDAATDAADERLLREMSDLPLEASGHVSAPANVHIQPSRDAPIVAQLGSGQPLQIYGRRLVQQRASEQHPADDNAPRKGSRDAWYLVRVGSRAGWILGRLIDLDIPAPIASYARESNVVAWLVLDTVEDEGRQVPQYLLADRTGSPEFDFTHIRVLTWWRRKQTYAVAYVEGGLQGYFPILVTHEGSTPYFRLRLVDEQENKFQRVYRLSDTITRVVGDVPGWESEAMPEPRSVPGRRARRR